MGIVHGPGFRRASLFLAAPALMAQTWTTFHSAYQDGLAAQSRGDHAQAYKAFARAANLEPAPGTRVHTYGLNFLPTYYPYLGMAQAALALGDVPTAEAALASPQSVAKEPPAQREALLARIKAMKQAAAPPPEVKPVPPAAAPAPVQAQDVPQSAPAAVHPVQDLPAAPEARSVPKPAPTDKPRTLAPTQETPRPVILQAGPVPSVAPPSPGPRRWPYLGGAVAFLGGLAGWILTRRRRKPVRTPWTDLATSVPGGEGAKPDQDSNLGRRFGPWEARHILGRGGCATAYHGVHAETGEEVAIKVPHSHLCQDREFLARFRREAALGSLLDHPRIVRILDPGPETGEPWLVMPFVKGVTLEAHLQRSSALPVPQAIHIASDVAEAMAYAHAKGVVHRDLKPANIMLSEQGAVVMDLGIARILEGGKITSMYIGTPTYSAPESVVNPSVGPPADRYALGIILFEMLAGHPPFQGETPFQVFEAHRFNPLPDLTAERPLVPPKLNRLAQRLCEKLPEDRPEDGETILILNELKKAFPLT